jgi:hypothetical protein
MTKVLGYAPALLILWVLAGPSPSLAAGEVEGWAVVIEMNDFPEPYSDIPVDHLNSERVRDVLLSLGWDEDRIRVWTQEIRTEDLSALIDWLITSSDADDLVLLYVFTHGNWMSEILHWNEWVPQRWANIPSQRRVMIVDTCKAGSFTDSLGGDDGQLLMSACSGTEYAWAGIEEEGLPVLGSVWGHFLTNALTNSSADYNHDGWISAEEAFKHALPLTQGYMDNYVFGVQEFLEMYHAFGVFPAKIGGYPNPTIIDGLQGDLILDLSYYVRENHALGWLALGIVAVALAPRASGMAERGNPEDP